MLGTHFIALLTCPPSLQSQGFDQTQNPTRLPESYVWGYYGHVLSFTSMILPKTSLASAIV